MDKLRYPRGLIRFATENGLAGKLSTREVLRRVARPRVLVYTAVLMLICGALLTGLVNRLTFKVDVVRDRGALAREVQDGWIENVYRLQIMNATEESQRYRLSVRGLAGAEIEAAGDVVVGPAQARWVPVDVRLPPESAARVGPGAHRFDFLIERLAGPSGEPASSLAERSTFLVPR
jgi:polyferredoxin